MFSTSHESHDTGAESRAETPELSNSENVQNAAFNNNNSAQVGGNAASSQKTGSSPFGGINGNDDVNSNMQQLTPKQMEELKIFIANNRDHHYQHDTLHPVTDDSSNQSQSHTSTISARALATGRILADLLIVSVHGFMNLFYPSTGAEELTSEEKKSMVVSDEELDDLALFQGVVETYLVLHVGQVAPPKIEKMRELLKDENHIEWERRCRQLMPQSTLQTDQIRALEWRAKLRGFLGSWGRKKCSQNIYILDDQLTAHRVPMVNQTDGVRGKMGVMSGKHAWDFKVTGPIGTHFSVGVSTEKGPLISTKGYVSLIGGDERGESWGWDLVWGNLSHKGRTIGDYPRFIIYQYTPGDIIRLTLDCDKGDMSFAVNEMFFGVAVKNLPKDVPLYPTVGMVYGNMEVSCVYLGVPPTLRN